MVNWRALELLVVLMCSLCCAAAVRVRIHQTLGVTPSMASGITDKVWEVEDMVALLSNYTTTLHRHDFRQRSKGWRPPLGPARSF